jgi:hypothetical protein
LFFFFIPFAQDDLPIYRCLTFLSIRRLTVCLFRNLMLRLLYYCCVCNFRSKNSLFTIGLPFERRRECRNFVSDRQIFRRF